MAITAEATGPSPKRRRTDNSSVTTISPEQILQSNATVQHFTGQRHNRWMQGFVPSAVNRDGGDTNASSRASNRQTGNGPAPGRATSAETRPESDNLQGQSLNSMAANGGAARANWQLRPDAAGTNDGSPAVSASQASIVNYESPYNSNLPSATNERSSMDRNMSVNTPGLPSPAPSDETTNSPVTVTGSAVTMPNSTPQPPKRGPGRPRKHPLPTPILPSNSSPILSPAMQQQQHRPQAPPGGSVSGGDRVVYVRSNAHSPTATHQRTPSGRVQSAASATQAFAPPVVASPTLQPSPSNDKMFTPHALKSRIDSFERHLRRRNLPPGVDEGRLSLLRDAVNPQIDWFYLALSQVHALMEQQHPDLPESVRSLSPRCWKYLDDLVCSNKTVSPELLNWLAEFPTPIRDVYADPALSSAYSTYVNAVASFLRELPNRWDTLVSHCRRMQAPPLAQDLTDGLGLRSSVLQSVAFRAIGRMIYDAPNDAHVMEHLEPLHRSDLQAYNQGYFRQGAEKANAYRAFHRVREAWGRWLQMRQDHDAMQRNLPPISRTGFPNFNLSYFAPDAITVFYPRQASGDAVPNNAPFTSQQRQSQQQQAMLANQQFFQQAQAAARPLQSRVNTQSPAQPDMPQRQPPNGFVAMPPQRHAPSPRLVFPHESEGVRSQPTEPNAARSALHEAHLRSPVSVPLKIGDEMPRLYRYVRRYALSPTRLDKDMPINTVTFHLPQEEIDKIPKTLPSQNPGELSNRILSEISQTYRLRCCPIKPNGFPTETDWVVADTHWPDTLYMELNGHVLVTRGPLHHKKFLPVDLTDMVKPGVNEIRAVINRMSTDQRPFDFALAVEIVGVVSHSTLIAKLESEQFISAATTKSSIQKALAGAGGGDDDDDDDIAITSTSMTIKLFDPFSGSKIFSTPVRGANCPHKDCFDLETFLSQCKRDKPGHPTIVDCWRCPLCRGDVRPSVMVRDEWLVDVRKSLEKQGKLDTRAIVVEADGSWKPKLEEKTGVRSASLEREEGGVGAGAKRTKSNDGTPAPGPAAAAKKVIEIIELD